MRNARTFRAVGIAMLVIGAALLLLGFSGDQTSFRVSGPVLAFVGIVLLAQAKRRP